jgi:hypothetical protein
MQTTVRIALSCIPEILKSLPIFIVIDDTLQAKFGVHFECRKELFDHTARNGSNYLNGHCFVGLILKIPVFFKNQDIYYLKVSIGYRLKKDNPDKSKLQIASEMINYVMEILKNDKMVILCCDSWYPKGEVLETVKKHNNLELIANVRVDTIVNDLPPEPTGKRGRPRKKGARLVIYKQEHFNFSKIGKYFVATRKVITNLFKNNVVYATVTTPALDKAKSYRLFISTVMPEQLEHMLPVVKDEIEYDISKEQLISLLPYILYKFRWPIEVVFYEQKTFWSFGKYMLRSITGIENYVNIINICYTCMSLLPWKNKEFAELKGESPQHIKYILGQQIHYELFLASFVSDPENTKKYWSGIKTVISKVLMRKGC